jgi:hypothetical protein
MADQLTLGPLLREAGTRQIDRAYPEWAEKAREGIEELAARRQTFTADDLHDLIGPPPHPNCTGAAFRKASKDGLIVCVGLTTSKRAPRHASAQRVWIGKEMVA